MVEFRILWVLKPVQMTDPTIAPKVSNFMEKSLSGSLANITKLLIDGDLHSAEQLIMKQVLEVYDYIFQLILPLAAEDFSRNHLPPQGCQSRSRQHSIKIATGTSIALTSPYYRQVTQDYQGNRRPLLDHWQTVGTASPLLSDRTAFLAMLAPSYELASQALNKFGVEVCTTTVRKITDRTATICNDKGHACLIVEPGFTLAGKRVVISVDGGRTRVREMTGRFNERGNERFATLWKEPKLFVIDVLDEDGRADRHELPIYGCKFQDTDMLDALKAYLSKFEIHLAAHVQLIADGATWIWNNVPNLLRQLDVDDNKLTETLDYYHASEYAHELVKLMPKRVGKKERKHLLQSFKGLLESGNPAQVVKQIVAKYKRTTKLVRRYINYLEKHTQRMHYADYKDRKLMCGSGIIESAVRRIINLRFKNASTFWYPETVENLYFLRGALVAKRWEVVMKNLFNPAV